MNDWLIFLPMLVMGLVSSAHCIGMCGGIMGALSMAIPAQSQRWKILLAYNLGRIASYSAMGFLLGLFAEQLVGLGGASVLRILAGALLVAMGLYLANWWRGLTYVEALGRYLWAYIQPLGKYLLPVDNVGKALLLGALWGWLPCGLIYSALALAMTQTASVAAGSMLAFGIGTLPAVMLAGVAAQQLAKLLQQRQVRIGLSLLIIIYGCWTIYGGMAGHAHHHQPAEPDQHHDHSTMQHNHSTMQQDHSKMQHDH